MMAHPRLILTGGDPCGIGPEVILKALARGRPTRLHIVVIGDRRVFDAAAKRLGRPSPAWRVVPAERAALLSSGHSDRLVFVDCANPGRFLPGRASRAAGGASLAYLRVALALIRRDPDRTALVTAPVTKWAIEESGTPFAGHTEFLAEALGARRVAMMFVSERLKLVLLTRHLPLRRVSRALSAELVHDSLLLTHEFLRRRLGAARPRLAVCGLNPHAGERGRFGDEERRVIGPALARLRRRGVSVDGPLAADGLFSDPRGPAFRPGSRGGYDAVACCYHDQGLIPFKLTARDRGCQVTLGLPIVRTSPDHGSALDLAGRDCADPGSMRYAIRLAAALIRNP